MRTSKDHNEEELSHWKALNEHRETRISKLSTRTLPFNHSNWSEEIERTTNTLLFYIGLFKPDQEESKQVQHISIPCITRSKRKIEQWIFKYLLPCCDTEFQDNPSWIFRRSFRNCLLRRLWKDNSQKKMRGSFQKHSFRCCVRF